MLWPYCGVVDITFEVSKTLNWWRISSRGETDARNEPFAEDLASIRALNKPLLGAFVKDSAVYVLVVCYVLLQLPFLLEMIKISSELWATWIAFLEGEVSPDF